MSNSRLFGGSGGAVSRLMESGFAFGVVASACGPGWPGCPGWLGPVCPAPGVFPWLLTWSAGRLRRCHPRHGHGLTIGADSHAVRCLNNQSGLCQTILRIGDKTKERSQHCTSKTALCCHDVLVRYATLCFGS
jgi:hypothetical protein